MVRNLSVSGGSFNLPDIKEIGVARGGHFNALSGVLPRIQRRADVFLGVGSAVSGTFSADPAWRWSMSFNS